MDDQAYRAIRKRLVSIRNRIVGIELLLLFVRIAVAVVALLLGNVLAGFLISGTVVRGAVAWLSLALLLFLVAGAVRLFACRWPRLSWIAAEAEHSTSDLEGDLLRGALDLGGRKDRGRFGYSSALVTALIEDALRKSKAIRERTVLRLDRIRKALPLVPVVLAAAAFLFLLVPHRTADVVRALGPADRGRLLEEIGFVLTPGDCDALPGEPVEVEARFSNYRGASADLLVRSASDEVGGWRTFPMAERSTDGERLFEGMIPPLEENAVYLVRFDGGESPSYEITVQHPPLLTDIAYTLSYPSYTGLEDRPVRENHGNVTALFGTEVALTGTANRELAAARLERDGGDPIPLRTDGERITGGFRVDERFSYRVLVEDEAGRGNESAVRYEVVPVADERPFVRITWPGEDINLDQEMKIDLRFSALDDYGVTAVNLLYRTGEEKETRVSLFSTGRRVTELDREREWDLSGEKLFPDEVISYYLEVWDNDSLSGPKRGVSRTYHLRMPSLAEIFADVSDDQETEIADLEELFEEGMELKEKLDEISREIRKNDEVSWDEKKKIERIVEKQKEIEESLREVSEELERTTEQLEENRLITPETVEKMVELTRLLNEVATEEMREALQKLQESMRELDQEEIRKAAEELELTQQDFMERLDRTIEMLKRVRDLQEMEALSEGLQQLAEEQRDLRKRSEEADPSEMERLAKEEEALARQLEQMQKAMEEMAKRSAENSPDLSDQVRESLSDMKKKQTSSTMKKAAGELRQGEKEDASQSQKEAEDDLFDLAFRLAQSVQSFCNASGKKAQAAFGESIQDLLYLSKGQEEILGRAEGGGRNTSVAKRRSLAEREQEVAAGIGRVMDKVREVGKEVPQISEMVLETLRRGRRKAETAATRFEEGRFDLARTRGGEAMSHVNRTVVELLRSQESHSSSCSNPNSQGEGLQQMQQMTQEQRGLNQQSSQVPLPSSNPASIPMETRANMNRLAAEQRKIRKGLEQLQGEVEGEGDVLGRLDRIMEEMRQVERDLESANLSPETRERQEKILSRMLDAQRSLRDRGFRKERRSRSGSDREATTPVPVPRSLQEARERMREDPVRMPGFVYPPEYEDLIRIYFETLSKERDE